MARPTRPRCAYYSLWCRSARLYKRRNVSTPTRSVALVARRARSWIRERVMGTAGLSWGGGWAPVIGRQTERDPWDPSRAGQSTCSAGLLP